MTIEVEVKKHYVTDLISINTLDLTSLKESEYSTIIATNFHIENNKIDFNHIRSDYLTRYFVINLFWVKSETKIYINIHYNKILKRFILEEELKTKSNQVKVKKTSYEYSSEYIHYLQERYSCLK